jgi:hypothetical protein
MDSKIDLETQGGRGGREIDPRDEMTVPKASFRIFFGAHMLLRCSFILRTFCNGNGDSGFYQNRKNAKVGITISAAETCAK